MTVFRSLTQIIARQVKFICSRIKKRREPRVSVVTLKLCEASAFFFPKKFEVNRMDKRTRQPRDRRRKGQEAGRPVLKRGNESTQRVEQSLLPYPHALAFAFARTKPFAFQVIFSTVLLLMLPLPSDGNTAPETRISLLPLPPTGHIASERKSQRRAVGQDCPKNPKSQSVC